MLLATAGLRAAWDRPGGRDNGRSIALHGVLVHPSRAVLETLAAAVANGRLRPVVGQVLDWTDAAAAHRRVESRHDQGKVVLRLAG